MNDSQAPLGSNRDRHADLPHRRAGRVGAVRVPVRARFDGLPAVLEKFGDDVPTDLEQIAIAKSLRKRGLARRRRRAKRGSEAP